MFHYFVNFQWVAKVDMCATSSKLIKLFMLFVLMLIFFLQTNALQWYFIPRFSLSRMNSHLDKTSQIIILVITIVPHLAVVAIATNVTKKTTSNYHQSHPYQQQIQNKKVIEIKVTKRQTINEKEHLPCDLFELYSYTCLAVFTWFLNNWLFRISFADVFGAALDSTCNRKKTNIFKSNYKENGVSNNNTNV